MKTNNTNILSTILITGAIAALILMSNIVLSSATMQSNGDTSTSALKILKDGDSNGSISQAEEAKKLLTT
jgi:hypothetical protein